MQEEWNEQERADCRRLYCALLCAALIGLSIFLTSCAPHVLTAPSLAQSQTQNAAIEKNVVTAQADINNVLRDNAIMVRPDLTLELQDADGQLVDAQATIGQQASQLAASQSQIDQVTAAGNQAIAAFNNTLPKHQRDVEALVVAWALCSLACILGPLLFKAYPALVFFPTSLESVVCSIVAFCICSGVASLLILFGVL